MSDQTPRFTRILSIDGGGIRGIIPGQVLVALEKRLQVKTGNPGARIADFFDLIAGTSTGGILACICLAPKDPADPAKGARFSAEEAVGLYLDRGDEIFDIPVMHRIRTAGGVADEKYPAEGLEEALQDYFGDLRLSQLLKPCLVTSYDIRRRQAMFFAQHDAVKDPAWDFLVRDIARATSAAPTYFEVARVKSVSGVPYPVVDGGVFANNPTLCAYAEARSKLPGKPTASQMVILSLGTGVAETPYHFKEAKDWGLIGWARPIIDIMMSGVAETVDYQLGQMFDAVGKPAQYVRIQADLVMDPPEVKQMDNARTSNMARLREIGIETAEKEAEKLAEIADLLIAAGPAVPV